MELGGGGDAVPARRELLVIAHGSGADAVLRYLETAPPTAVDGLVLVAPGGDEYHAAERHGRAYVWPAIRGEGRRGVPPRRLWVLAREAADGGGGGGGGVEAAAEGDRRGGGGGGDRRVAADVEALVDRLHVPPPAVGRLHAAASAPRLVSPTLPGLLDLLRR